MGGGDKCLMPLGGRPLLAHAIDRLTPQVDAMVLSVNGDPDRFSAFGLPSIADGVADDAGPLAGILAGMTWARTHQPAAEAILTVATDTPFFPDDLAARLVAARPPGGIAIARTGGRAHRVFGVFPVACAEALVRYLKESESRKVGDWLDRMGFVAVDFDDPVADGVDPFFNINTPDDLPVAERKATADSGPILR